MSHFLNLDNSEETVQQQLFFGTKLGLFDNITESFPKINHWAKFMKLNDWDEKELPMSSCLVELRNNPELADGIINMVSWQWETDTALSRSIVNILGPFITYDGLARLYLEIQRNEAVHAATYSEITKTCFEDPIAIKKIISEKQEAFARLRPASDIFDEVYQASLDYASGRRSYDQSLANLVYKYLVALQVIENDQFGPSFTYVASAGRQGLAVPIAENLRRIGQDEINIHVPAGKAVLDNYLSTEAGLMAFNQCSEWTTDFIESVRSSEYTFNKQVIFKDKADFFGLTEARLNQFVDWQIQDTYSFLMMKNPQEILTDHPIPFMKTWFTLDRVQSSPQEMRSGNYLIGGLVQDLPRGKVELHV